MGAVAVAPVPLLDHVFVIENAGVDYALVHVLEVDETGAGFKEAQTPFRLDRKCQCSAEDSRSPNHHLDRSWRSCGLRYRTHRKETRTSHVAADQPPTYDYPTATRMAIGKSEMWVSGTRIARYELQINTGRVVPDWVKNPGDSFIGEPFATRDVLVHARMLRGTSGIRVTAVDPETSEVFWTTDVGVPVAMLTPAPGREGCPRGYKPRNAVRTRS